MIRSLFGGDCRELLEDQPRLYKHLKAEDDNALRCLYKIVYPEVRKIVLGFSNYSEEEAEDIFQYGMMNLWANIRDGKFVLRKDVKITSYLHKICRNRMKDIGKAKPKSQTKRIKDGFDAEDGTDMEKVVQLAEHREQLLSLFSRLKGRCQKVLKLSYFDALTDKEIAREMAMDYKQVRKDRYRCLKNLKKFKDEIDTPWN